MKLLRVFFVVMVSLLLISAPVSGKKNKTKSLPPGLQKKVERGGELPPGWQKKLKKGETLDQEVYNHGTVIKPVNKDGIITIKIEDRILRVIEATREIVDILGN